MESAGHDAPPRIAYVNPAVEAITGYRAAELVGRSTQLLFAIDEAGEADRRNRAGSGASGELELLRKDGSRMRVEWSASPIPDDAGLGTHLVAVVRDVTGLRAVERDLRESLEGLRTVDAEQRRLVTQLVEAQELELDRMAEGIEDRSLQQMTAVRMRMETLRRSVSDPDQLGALDKLESSVTQAVGQLRGLLSELRPRELATEGLAAAIRSYLDGLDGSLRTSVEGGFVTEPAPSQQATAFRIVQEAVAFAVGSRGATRLAVTLASDDEGFTVRVHDDGAAWSLEAPSTMGDRARLAGGRCTVEASEGGGAIVDLRLPAIAAADH
jgi:two-component system sensor histidine kinase UhpB